VDFLLFIYSYSRIVLVIKYLFISLWFEVFSN